MQVAPAVVAQIMAIRAALRVALPVDRVPADEEGGGGGLRRNRENGQEDPEFAQSLHGEWIN